MQKTIPIDDYILDTLLRDLTGHDRKPAAFLVYLWLTGEQSRRKVSCHDQLYRARAEHRPLAQLRTIRRSLAPAPQAAVVKQGKRDGGACLHGPVPLA